jgi:hypothetical protein
MFTLRYDANGGTGAPASHSVIRDNQGSARITISSAIPSRNGFNFEGWGVGSVGGVWYRPGETITRMSGDNVLTLYAVWGALPAERPIAPSVTFTNLRTEWSHTVRAEPGRFMVDNWFRLTVDTRSDVPITEVGIVLMDNNGNEITSVNRGISPSQLQTRDTQLAIHRVERVFHAETPSRAGALLSRNDTPIVHGMVAERTYRWYAYVISDGNRITSQEQSFVFSPEP